MISKSNVKSFPCDGVFVVIYFKTMYNQDLGKCYQPRPSARLVTLTMTLIIPDITKTSSNNCLLSSNLNEFTMGETEDDDSDAGHDGDNI